MRFIAKLLMLVMMSVGFTAVTGPPAHAATGSWSFKGGCCVYIPGGSHGTGFTTTKEKDIYFKISSWNPCDTNDGDVEITVKLYKNDAFDHQVGATKNLTCTGTVKWSMVNPGKYYFYMRVKGPWDEGSSAAYTAKGYYYYNGTTP